MGKSATASWLLRKRVQKVGDVEDHRRGLVIKCRWKGTLGEEESS